MPRKYAWQVDPATIKEEDKVVLMFNDMHLPYSKIEYLDWLKGVAIQFGVNTIVCNGDAIDNHAISFHDTEPDAMGAEDEFEKAYDMLHEYIKIFPYVYYSIGNHDILGKRKAAKMGLSDRYIKSFSELYGLPDTWVVKDYHIINNVFYTHGQKGSKGGINSAFNSAINNRMSTCLGHYHGQAGVKYQSNGISTIFGASGGCLLDNNAYSFRYGERATNKPILGCTIIYSSSFALFVPYKERS